MTDPVVTIKQGTLKGFKSKDHDGNEYLKFYGIPYAKPPVGNLRFRAPQPPEAWNGTRDGTKEGSPCFQYNLMQNSIEGSEDCLYLNVATRRLPAPEIDKMPVMVHLHGGGFTMGSGTETLFGGPDYLMTGDIVFVNMNYRLGVLGFLALDDFSFDIPGNAGLKDQRMGLKWVQENIASFNGDPNNVTIFGISAGGASVHFQLISDSTKGLFHKAISQSGTALSPWAWGNKNNALVLAKKLDPNIITEKEAVSLLLKVDPKKLCEAAKTFTDDLLLSQEKRPFCPVIEKPNPTQFLTKCPMGIMRSGEFNHVPLIIGCTSNEGLLYDMSQLFNHTFSLNDGIPWYSNLKPDTNEYQKLKNEITELYFKNGETLKAKHEFYSDLLFVNGVIECAHLQRKVAKYPIYLYHFDPHTPFSQAFLKVLSKESTDKGASHGADGSYLFKRTIDDPNPMMPKLDPTPEDLKVVRNIVGMWTQFARTGKPDEDGTWEALKKTGPLRALNIDVNLAMIENPFARRTAFWENYFEKVWLKFD